MFPGPYAEIFRNEEGEVIGWDNHYYDEPPYCDSCGFEHVGECRRDPEDDDDES